MADKSPYKFGITAADYTQNQERIKGEFNDFSGKRPKKGKPASKSFAADERRSARIGRETRKSVLISVDPRKLKSLDMRWVRLRLPTVA